MRASMVIVIAVLLVIIPLAGCLQQEIREKITVPGSDLSTGGEGNITNGGGGETGSAGGGHPSGGRVKIVFWHTFENPKEIEVLKDVIAEFEKENPNIKVDVQQQPYDGAIEKFKIAAQGGEAPDVMRVPNDRLGDLAYSDLIENLDGYVSVSQKESYVPMAINAMMYKGHLYALPASYDCMALIYNKDIFQKYGFSQPPETLDDMVSMAQAMTHGDTYGLVFPITDPYWWFPFQYAFGGRIFDENNHPEIYSPASVNATEFLISLEKKYHIIPEGGVDKNTMMSLFVEQKAAMIITGPWSLPTIKASEVNYGIAPLPKNSQTGKYAAPLVGVKGYVISKTSEHKMEAYELIKFLTSAEVTKKFAIVSNTLPSVKSVYTDENITSNSDIQGFLSQANYGQQMPTIPEMSAVWNPLTTALEAVYTGEMSADAALKEAQREIEEQIG